MVISNCCVIFVVFSVVVGGDGVVVALLRVVVTHTFLMFLLYLAIVVGVYTCH